MSNLVTFYDFGYIGCNFCGHITCHNADKPSIMWILCKNCKFINNLGGNPLKGLNAPSTSPYTKTSSDKQILTRLCFKTSNK